MSSSSTINTWSSRLSTALAEPSTRYGANDAGEWQEILDKARAVEASAQGMPSDGASVAFLNEQSLPPHPIERDLAAWTQAGRLARPSSAAHVSFLPSLEGLASPAYAQLDGLAMPLLARTSSGEDDIVCASSQGKTTAAAMPTKYAQQAETASGMNVTWVTDDLGHVQLHLRARELSRHGALELAQRLRAPGSCSAQANPAVLVLNGIVLYDHRPGTRQGVIFIG